MRANAESLLRSNPHVCAKRGTEWQGAMFAVNNFAVNNFAVKNFRRRDSKYWCELNWCGLFFFRTTVLLGINIGSKEVYVVDKHEKYEIMNEKESAEQTDEDNKSQLTFSQAEARVHLPHW